MSPEQLFPTPGREFLTLLAALPKHLDAAMPMRKQHRRELPGDIRHLSHLLTDERGDLRRDYLSDPAALSAYMRYFLPWNIYRLGVLFAGLAIDPGGDTPKAGATVIDLGTGPLTAPLALWMSRPHLRKRPLTFICVDRAPKPMRLGLDALNSMASAQGGLAPWKVTLVKGPLDARLRERADLLIMANALNEVLRRGEGELLENAEALAGHLASMLTPAGAALIVEPGVRPSAHLLAALRRGFLHRGLKPLAPCPHTEPCPMSGRGYTAWCHFNFDAEPAPGWLKKLSDDAKLPKDNVSLSLLHFSAKGRKLDAAPGKSLVRAVSGPFALPAPDDTAPRRFGQYACSERGLTLLSLPRKHMVPLPGTLLEAAWPDAPETDAKSGAIVLPLGADALPEQLRQPPRPVEAQRSLADRPAGASGKPGRTGEPARTDRAKPARAAKPGVRDERDGYDGRDGRRTKPEGPRPAAPKPPRPRPTGPKAGKPDQALTVDSMLADEFADAPKRPAKGQPDTGEKDQTRRSDGPSGKRSGKRPGKPGGKPAPKAPKRRKGDA